MFILYTVAPILYRMASSAYYNLSLLSSDFYGLLFGLFLYVRRCSFSFAHCCMLTLYAWAAAFLRVLVVFPRLRRRPARAHHLLLARDAYVPPHSLPFLRCAHPPICLNLAEEQGKLEPRAPEYVVQRNGANTRIAGQV